MFYLCNFKTKTVVDQDISIVELLNRTQQDPDNAIVSDLDFWGITKGGPNESPLLH